MKTSYNIAVLPGDGIGVEVMAVCLKLLEHLQKQSNEFQLKLKQYPAGAAHYRDVGDALPQGTWEACRDADAILFGAMGLPEVRYPDGTEIGPQLTLRQHLDLFAGVRPIRAIPGAPLALADSRAKLIDLVIVREQSEGWFFGRYHPEKVPKASVDEAYDLGRITRQGSERLFHFAFELAQHRGERLRRPPRVTCVDKSNVHRGQAFMFSIFKEVAQAY
ncbi:MAG: isocitrate/isopropylmalate dehydrogenase family protein, partial [Betaproteobacteria bacterium]|nr:isocitrate/isopropylmalate dehydrogenase family protein [Betaproteobacteria bacterium]